METVPRPPKPDRRVEGVPGAGLWVSRDNGKTWGAFDELPFSNIQRVKIDPAHADVIHVTTFGDSVWRGQARPTAR